MMILMTLICQQEESELVEMVLLLDLVKIIFK